MRFRATEPVAVDDAERFFSAAPFLAKVSYEFPDLTPDQLWGVVSSDRMWSWLPTVWGCRYPEGAGVEPGVVRDFQMYVHHWLVYAQRERIIHVEPGRRMMYTATDATLPFFGTWLEDYRIEPVGAGSRLVWRMGVRPRFVGWLPARWLSRLLTPVLRFGLRGVRREVGDGGAREVRMVGGEVSERRRIR
ncbi:SRPBCC family protein [Tsukamurella ocularis]|uniref:SRPBCC family protein n=1 Tax=Tsukamurella ocularis TaxID=1970234 RepID=UPI002167DC55|nr:SRPBCC family protein [Tsukamurella ocularis]